MLVPFLFIPNIGDWGFTVAKTTTHCRNGTLTTYSGTPKDILVSLCTEITNVLEKNGIVPTGLHLLAMVHIVAGFIKHETENPTARLGKMPTFKMLITVLARNFTNTPYSAEETEIFNEEFKEMIESLGGSVISTVPASSKQDIFMAPMSTEVH